MKKNQLNRMVERAKLGDVNAFAEIYAHLSKSAYYLAYKLVQNKEDAMDIMQDSMLKLYDKIGSLKNTDAVVTYTSRIVHSTSMNYLKKSGKLILTEDVEDFEEQYEQSSSALPEEYLDTKEKRLAVAQLVNELPESQRAVVVLFYYDQLKAKQIAEILDINEKSVLARLGRARNTLRRMIETREPSKEGVLHLMGIPLFSQLLVEEAESLITPADQISAWKSLGASLELPLEIAAEATQVVSGAISSSVTSAATSAVSGILAGKGILIGIAATVLIAGGAFGFLALSGEERSPGAEPAIPPHISAEYESPDINIEVVPTVDDNIIASLEESAASPNVNGASVEAGATTPDFTPQAEPERPVESEIPSPPPQVSEPPKAEESPPVQITKPKLTFTSQQLHLTLGENLTLEEIISLSGISATDSGGLPIEYEVNLFETINWEEEGIYTLQIYLPATETTREHWSFIAIYINEK